MFGQEGKTFVRILTVASVLVPISIMFWNVQWGVIALLLGLFTLGRAIQTLRTMHLEGTLADQDALYQKANRGQTIYVQLVDDAGVALPVELANAKLAAAQQQAGPRHTVLGVHRKI